MNWQDVALATGGFVFSIALIPSVVSASGPHWFTSLLTGAVLSAFCIIYATMKLKLAAISVASTAVLWWILLGQHIWGWEY